MSKRTDQMSSVLRRAVQSVLSEGLADPRLEGAMVTVTKVKVTDDARTAVVSVSVIPEKKQKLAWHALRDASRFIRRRAADLVSIHKMPELVFKLDTSLKRQASVLDAIARSKDELGEHGGAPSSHAADQPTLPDTPPNSDPPPHSDTPPHSDPGETTP